MKTIEWVGTSKKDLMKFPTAVVQEVGYALYVTQKGAYYKKAKPLKGLGSGVYELAIDYHTDAYRTVYLLSLKEAVYVIHCFQKKSKHGIKTPQEEIDIIKQRLKLLRS